MPKGSNLLPYFLGEFASDVATETFISTQGYFPQTQSSAPTTGKIPGIVYKNTTTGDLRMWTGSQWESISGVPTGMALDDLNNVTTTSVLPGSKLYYNATSGEWENETFPVLSYGSVKNEDWSPTWAELAAHGSVVFGNTSVTLTDFVGNATVATLNGIGSPTTGTSYLVTDTGTLTVGALAVTPGTLVLFTGGVWTLVSAGVGGFAQPNIRVQLSSTTALIAPYTDGVDDGKIVYFNGTSNTGVFTTLDVEITLPDPSGAPLNDGLLRRLYVGNFGGAGGHVHIHSSHFIDEVTLVDLKRNGESILLGMTNNSMAASWMRISSLGNTLQIRRAATWSAASFNAATAVPFDTEDHEGNPSLTSWEGVTNPSRMTFGFDGCFAISGMASINSTGGGTWNLQCFLRKNGTTEIPGSRLRTGNYGSEDDSVTMSPISVNLVAGDYLEWVFDHYNLTGYMVSAVLSASTQY